MSRCERELDAGWPRAGSVRAPRWPHGSSATVTLCPVAGKAETPRDRYPVDQVEGPLDQEGEHGRRDRALQDQRVLPELDAGKDGLSQASSTNQGRQGRRSDVDDGARL